MSTEQRQILISQSSTLWICDLFLPVFGAPHGPRLPRPSPAATRYLPSPVNQQPGRWWGDHHTWIPLDSCVSSRIAWLTPLSVTASWPFSTSQGTKDSSKNYRAQMRPFLQAHHGRRPQPHHNGHCLLQFLLQKFGNVTTQLMCLGGRYAEDGSNVSFQKKHCADFKGSSHHFL